MEFNNLKDQVNLTNTIALLEKEINDLKSEIETKNDGLKEKDEGLNERFLKLEAITSRLEKIDTSLAHLTINQSYKNFYEWRVRPAIDIVALLSSSANNLANVAIYYSNNMYAKKHEVKKALKISNRILDEIEKGMDLFEIELEYLIDRNDIFSSCNK